MRRIYGALAVFLGWLCFLGSVGLGLMATDSLGVHYTGGPLPLSTVYGIPDVFVMWIIILVAFVGAFPIDLWIMSPNPRRPLYGCAVGLIVAAVALLPDELGRIHALAFVVSALLFALGGYILGTPKGAAEAAQPAAATGSPAPATPAPDLRVAAAPAPAPAPAAAKSQPVPAAPATPSARGRAPRKTRGVIECPWCSVKNKASAAVCQGCGAALREAPATLEEEIPGVTIVSPKLIAYEMATRAKATKKTGFLAAMLGGDRDPRIMEPAADAPLSAYEPPSRDVKLEMARLAHDLSEPVSPEPVSPPKRSGRAGPGSGA